MATCIFIVYIYVIVFSFWGDIPTSGIHVPTSRKTMPVSSSPMKMECTECSEKSAHKLQTPENHPKERIQHSV